MRTLLTMVAALLLLAAGPAFADRPAQANECTFFVARGTEPIDEGSTSLTVQLHEQLVLWGWLLPGEQVDFLFTHNGMPYGNFTPLTADGEGFVSFVHDFASPPGLEGKWTITATALGTGCQATVEITVLGTPAPSRAPGALPDTSVEAVQPGAHGVVLTAIALALVATSWMRTRIRPQVLRRMRRVRTGAAAVIATVLLASCAASPLLTPQASPEASAGIDTSAPSAAAIHTPSVDASGDTTASVAPSESAAADLTVDGLAEVLAEDLILRVEPGTGSERIGLLPLGEPAYVVGGPVEADGYRWYQLASVREPYGGTCGDPAPEPSLECARWFGWAAGVTPDEDRWLGVRAADCPKDRGTEAYLALLPAERLACAGSDEWRLVTYVAPKTEGRGCYTVYVVDPLWLDGSCNLLFLQPEESQYDSFEGLQVFVHPELGSCTVHADRSDCPFDSAKGSWVEVTGHLDDPAAPTCAPVLSSNFEDAPYPPPSTEEVVFRCRTRLVVTEVEATTAPDG